MSSKYDLVKVTVFSSLEGGSPKTCSEKGTCKKESGTLEVAAAESRAFYVFSRFVLARLLRFCEVSGAVAARVALKVKKHLVLENKLALSHASLVSIVQQTLLDEGVMGCETILKKVGLKKLVVSSSLPLMFDADDGILDPQRSSSAIEVSKREERKSALSAIASRVYPAVDAHCNARVPVIVVLVTPPPPARRAVATAAVEQNDRNRQQKGFTSSATTPKEAFERPSSRFPRSESDEAAIARALSLVAAGNVASCVSPPPFPIMDGGACGSGSGMGSTQQQNHTSQRIVSSLSSLLLNSTILQTDGLLVFNNAARQTSVCALASEAKKAALRMVEKAQRGGECQQRSRFFDRCDFYGSSSSSFSTSFSGTEEEEDVDGDESGKEETDDTKGLACCKKAESGGAAGYFVGDGGWVAEGECIPAAAVLYDEWASRCSAIEDVLLAHGEKAVREGRTMIVSGEYISPSTLRGLMGMRDVSHRAINDNGGKNKDANVAADACIRLAVFVDTCGGLATDEGSSTTLTSHTSEIKHLRHFAQESEPEDNQKQHHPYYVMREAFEELAGVCKNGLPFCKEHAYVQHALTQPTKRSSDNEQRARDRLVVYPCSLPPAPIANLMKQQDRAEFSQQKDNETYRHMDQQPEQAVHRAVMGICANGSHCGEWVHRGVLSLILGSYYKKSAVETHCVPSNEK